MGHVLELVTLEAEVCPLASLLAAYEPSVGQYLQVMAHGRLRQTERVSHVTNAHLTLQGDHVEKLQTRWIAKCLDACC